MFGTFVPLPAVAAIALHALFQSQIVVVTHKSAARGLPGAIKIIKFEKNLKDETFTADPAVNTTDIPCRCASLEATALCDH